MINKEVSSEGVDIMLVLDTSQSMAAEDFKPKNRLEVAKKQVQKFITKRSSDKVGLIVFGGEAYTQCPLTLDYNVLLNFIDDIHLNMAGRGTSIGMALATGLNRLRHSEAKSKVIILLTDGENNSGEIDPLSAAKLASDMSVKVYTIGVGKEGGAPIPYEDPIYGKTYARNSMGQIVLTKIDEETLKKIAKVTNGTYFRAHDGESLEKIYEEINSLEKTKIKAKQHFSYHDFFPSIILLLLLLFMLELIIKNGVVILP